MVGAQPSMEIVAKENRITILNHEQGTREEKISDDPLNEPAEIASKWDPVKIDSSRMFSVVSTVPSSFLPETKLPKTLEASEIRPFPRVQIVTSF